MGPDFTSLFEKINPSSIRNTLLFGPTPFFHYLPFIFCSSLLIRLLQLLLEHTPHLHLIWKSVLTWGRLLPGLMNPFCCCMRMACFCLSPHFPIPFLDPLDLDKDYNLWKRAAWEQEIPWREEISLWDFRVKIILYIFWYPPITIFPSGVFQSQIHTPMGMISFLVVEHGPFLWRLDNSFSVL